MYFLQQADKEVMVMGFHIYMQMATLSTMWPLHPLLYKEKEL